VSDGITAHSFGGITVPLSTIYAYYEGQGKDPVALATEYFQKWAAKVPVGKQMIVAKMKCALADGPCGCPEDSSIYKCTGPYPPVDLFILLDVLKQGVEGVEMLILPAPQALIEDGHLHFVEFVGPAMSVYVKKSA
jgi:hypothetical protein